MIIVLALRKLRQGDHHEFKASLCYRPYHCKPVWTTQQRASSSLNTVWASLGKGVKGRKRPPFAGSTGRAPADPDTLQALSHSGTQPHFHARVHTQQLSQSISLPGRKPGRREGAPTRGSNSAEERSKTDLRQSVLRTGDRTKWQRAQPGDKGRGVGEGLLHCRPHPHSRCKRAGSPRGSLCSGKTWPERAALTHSSHMHPLSCVDELTDKPPLFP